MRSLLLFVLLSCLPTFLQATHNRAGEIIVRLADECGGNDGLRICATIITYTETFQTDVDRDSLLLDWGGGSNPQEFIQRTDRRIVAPGIQRNEYTACHSYNGYGTYTLFFVDQNRVAQVLNIDNGQSVNIPFSVSTTYQLTNPFVFGCNNSPELTQIPIENACIGSVWTHNPGAFDVDGDSLAFEFTVPQRGLNEPVRNYLLPNISVGNTGTLDINPQTGQITWDSPGRAGEYNLAFMIKSFRNGVALDTVVRDMQIFVEECNNLPPELDIPVEEICVVAGELIEFDVVATAPLEDNEQQVLLEAVGRPFDLLENPATFTPEEVEYRDDPLTKTFRWRPDCSQVSNQPYFVVFRAEDDFFNRFSVGNRTGGLATLRSVSIRVVAPPPEDVQAVEGEESITVSWEQPYACEDQEVPELLGFTVWRRAGSNPFVVDTCETGLEGRGYERLTQTEVRDVVDGRYVYVDETGEPGRTYCYRVVALLGRPVPNLGLIFEEIESIPSQEVCVQLPRDIPLLTKVDVTATGTTDGEIDVCWLLPIAEALDTVLNPGPYRYVLSRADGQTADAGAFTTIQTYERAFFGEDVDTCYVDRSIDTEGTAYSYRIELFAAGRDEPVGPGQPASSVRLNAAPTDEAVDLDWSALVPWTNVNYEVFRRAPGEEEYSLLRTTTTTSLRDEGLDNGEEYCYFIRAEGTYNVESLPDSLINNSQEVCTVPLDNVPPCPPELTVISPCERGVDCTDDSNLFNTLNWVTPAAICRADDVAGYRIYYAETPGAEYVQIAQLENEDVTTFDDFPQNGITGCYVITAFDFSGNESDFSNEICVTNCPIYTLPNAFTPNGDGQNERFVPISRCFIERVDFQIFNRWGQLVFETEDPALDWDGTNPNGDALQAGTYFYRGTVFEQRLEGVTPAAEQVSGYIELVRPE